jgi:hypothetical protein
MSKPAYSKPPHSAQRTAIRTPSKPVAPSVYRPQPPPKVLQTKMATVQRLPGGLTKNAPVAPPAYRPQPLPKVLQRSAAPSPPARQTVQARMKHVAAKASQPGITQGRVQSVRPGAPPNAAVKRPVPPPVYRPEPGPNVLQRKCAPGQKMRKPQMPGNTAQRRLGIQGRGVVQRKFIANGAKATDFLTLIKYNSTQRDKIDAVERSDELNVQVTISHQPPPNLNDEILGVTNAVIDTNTGPVILNGSVDLDKDTLPAKLKGMRSMEIFVELYENFPTDRGLQQVPFSRQLFSMIHEFERHVFPFVDLYTSIQTASFNSQLFQDDSGFAKLSGELLQNPGPHGAVAQHVSPELAARTRITQENILASLGQQAASDEDHVKVQRLRADLAGQLDRDTRGRGVNMDAMNQHYQALRR